MDFEGGRIDEEQARTARYLWLAIRHSLFADWDPIGVRQYPQASGEYDAYASPIFRLHPDGWFGEHPVSERPMPWRVMWKTDRGVQEESHFETLEIAEYVRGLLLREYAGGDVTRVPRRPDGTQITFSYVTPAEGSMVWGQVAPYDGEAPS